MKKKKTLAERLNQDIWLILNDSKEVNVKKKFCQYALEYISLRKTKSVIICGKKYTIEALKEELKPKKIYNITIKSPPLNDTAREYIPLLGSMIRLGYQEETIKKFTELARKIYQHQREKYQKKKTRKRD